ncbi:MAG TPA: NAD-dependent epimerase/dehydratase family protein [Rhodanobacteraceae bacterium]|jgi:nucleoside-diphosphate-sugar epimerase
MTVSLVFGASGAVGRFLLPRLLAAGDEVVAVSREARTTAHPRVRWLVGGLPAAVPPLPDVDAIYSLGPLDAFAEWFARSRVSEQPRIVAIGSLSAVTKEQSIDPRERDLSARLRQAESMLAAAADARGCRSTLLRASLIYGAGLDRSLTPLVRFAERWRVFPTVTGAGGLRQPVHADDLADACVTVAGNAGAARSYDLGGGERLAYREMLARVRASLPVATVPLPVPRSLARALSGLARRTPAFSAASAAALRRIDENLVVDHAAAVADFGWSPRAFRPCAEDWIAPPLT